MTRQTEPLPGNLAGLLHLLRLIYTFRSAPRSYFQLNQESVKFNAQAYVPTQPASPLKDAWFSHPHEDEGWAGGDLPPARQRTQTGFREARFPGINFPFVIGGSVRKLNLAVNVSEVAPENLPKASGTRTRARFPRSRSLLRHRDFQLVYKRGKRHFATHMTLFYLPRAEGDVARFGFRVGKVLGGAVERNRIKRRLREAIRLHAGQLVAPLDVVIHPKKSTLKTDFSELKSEISLAFGIIEKSVQKPAYRNTD